MQDIFSFKLDDTNTLFFTSKEVKDKYAQEEYKFTFKERVDKYTTGNKDQLDARRLLFAKQQNYKPSTPQSGKWYHQPEITEKDVA